MPLPSKKEQIAYTDCWEGEGTIVTLALKRLEAGGHLRFQPREFCIALALALTLDPLDNYPCPQKNALPLPSKKAEKEMPSPFSQF